MILAIKKKKLIYIFYGILLILGITLCSVYASNSEIKDSEYQKKVVLDPGHGYPDRPERKVQMV